MFARVSTYQGSPERTDEGIRLAREIILPRLHQLDGYEGAYYLVDRQSGRAISITLWERRPCGPARRKQTICAARAQELPARR